MGETVAGKCFNPEDIELLVSKRILEHEVATLSRTFKEHEEREEKMISSISEKIDGLRNDVHHSEAALIKCKEDLKKEIETDFQTKMEARAMEERLQSSVKTLRDQILLAITVIVAVAGTVQYLLTTTSLHQRITKSAQVGMMEHIQPEDPANAIWRNPVINRRLRPDDYSTLS